MIHQQNKSTKRSGLPPLLLVLACLSGPLLSCADQARQEAAQFFLKGNNQLGKREYTEAIRYYTESIAKKPDVADVYNNRGLAYYRNGERELALADYTKAIQVDPAYEATYLNRAEALLETGDPAGSLADLQRIEKTYRDSTFYQTRLGDTFVRLNKTADAQVAYDRALQLSPTNVDALTNRGALFFQQKAYGPARQDCEKAVKLDPNQDAALNNLGMLLTLDGHYPEALAYVDRALTIQPTQAYYLNNRGYLLLMLGRDRDALPLVTQSLRIDDRNAWAHRNLGIYYLRREMPTKALVSLRQAEKLDASVDELYYYLGKAHLATNNKAAACEAFSRGELAGDALAKAEKAKNCR